MRPSYGFRWEDTGEGAEGTYDRFKVVVWGFGRGWQCKVFVHDPVTGAHVGICHPISRSFDSAMARGARWAHYYAVAGPPSPAEVMSDSFDGYASLYPTRLRWLDQLFCTNGNGYEWLDGAVVSESVYDPIERWLDDRNFDRRVRGRSRVDWRHHEVAMTLMGMEMEFADKRRAEDWRLAPPPDDGGDHEFYPLCEYSLIEKVPDNVRPEWLALARETAVALRDRSAVPGRYERGAEQRAAGARLVAALDARFGKAP